ncbi:cupin domain-containing protein [Williamsia sterculiae]|uniref:Cupin domain protein n=1 Tax=Williamsia sterculiae TaxID=1344003 RepID=A0A1N7H106_9NOCA|nr:cupin domain-containing protein [Williamsia sterculiae]SIS18505.1 Cupin domain protein [Williamsia sterculiae]
METPMLVRPSQQNRIAWIGDSEHDVVLSGRETGGRLSVFRSVLRAGTSAPVHLHPAEDETIVLLSGELAVWAGEESFRAHPGDTVFLPRGTAHTFAVVRDAELVTVCTPAGMEEFFRTAGWNLADGPAPNGWTPSPEGLQRAAVAGGQEILGPPLSPGETMPASALAAASARMASGVRFEKE